MPNLPLAGLLFCPYRPAFERAAMCALFLRYTFAMRARRVDANLGEIVKLARAAGFLVNIRNDDFADCDVQMPGVDRHESWEVKTAKGKFRPRQKEMREAGWIIWTIRTEDDVLESRKRFVGIPHARTSRP